MVCSQCQGIEEIFSQEHVEKELRDYRRKGPARTTGMLADEIEQAGVAGLDLLDIGGGFGAVQHILLKSGAKNATHVDASQAYLEAAKEEAHRRGLEHRVAFRHGDFIDLAEEIAPAEVVTLDRVICCYPDVENLIHLSAKKAGKIYGLVYPRDTWWVKSGLWIGNLYLRLRHSAYRAFCHPTKIVDAIILRNGFQRHSHRQTLVWQVVVYTR